MSDPATRRLGVFLSNGRGLSDWQALGSLTREVAVYRELAARGWSVTFVTYDRSRSIPDPGFPARVLPQWPLALPRFLDPLYGAAIPWLRRPPAATRPTVLLTNQAHSGWPALLAARVWGAKLVARCGYVYGEREEVAGRSGARVTRRRMEERAVFRGADRCLVPTPELADWIEGHYGIDPERIRVVPNNVDTDRFRPSAREQDVDILCIGRLTEKKRHQLLIEAMAGTGASLRIVGDGKWRDRLARLAAERGVRVDWIPSVRNESLPELFAGARLYVNLSRWEGHPKALIEAMACGCACLGARSPGIENLLVHGRTGWLVAPDASAVREAATALLADEDERARLGAAARSHAESHFSLARVTETTAAVLEDLA